MVRAVKIGKPYDLPEMEINPNVAAIQRYQGLLDRYGWTATFGGLTFDELRWDLALGLLEWGNTRQELSQPREG